MAKRILVPLRQRDRVENIIPCLEFIARPPTVVVFLIQRRARFYPWWSEHIATVHTEAGKLMPIRELQMELARQREQLSAEETIAPACKFLQARGITVNVELYDGSFGKLIMSHRSSADETIILKSQKHGRLWQILATMQCTFGRLDAGAMPFLLARPGRNV